MTETFGSRLKKLRIDTNLKQAQLARLVGVARTTICYYESDQRQPDFSILIRLADVFHVSTDFLLGRRMGDMLDVSGLTARDHKIVAELVEDLRYKNLELREK